MDSNNRYARLMILSIIVFISFAGITIINGIEVQFGRRTGYSIATNCIKKTGFSK